MHALTAVPLERFSPLTDFGKHPSWWDTKLSSTGDGMARITATMISGCSIPTHLHGCSRGREAYHLQQGMSRDCDRRPATLYGGEWRTQNGVNVRIKSTRKKVAVACSVPRETRGYSQLVRFEILRENQTSFPSHVQCTTSFYVYPGYPYLMFLQLPCVGMGTSWCSFLTGEYCCLEAPP